MFLVNCGYESNKFHIYWSLEHSETECANVAHGLVGMCWKYCVNSYRAMSVIRTLSSAVVKHCLQVWSPTIQWQPGSVRLLAPQLGHSHNWWRCNRGWFSLLIINHSPPQLCPAPDLDTAVNTVNTNIISWIRDPWINNGPIYRSSIVIIGSMLHIIIKAKSRLN